MMFVDYLGLCAPNDDLAAPTKAKLMAIFVAEREIRDRVKAKQIAGERLQHLIDRCYEKDTE